MMKMLLISSEGHKLEGLVVTGEDDTLESIIRVTAIMGLPTGPQIMIDKPVWVELMEDGMLKKAILAKMREMRDGKRRI